MSNTRLTKLAAAHTVDEVEFDTFDTVAGDKVKFNFVKSVYWALE